MFHPSPAILTLTLALAGATESPPADPLEIIHSGSYSTTIAPTPSARILNWNIDRGQHFNGIVSAIRETCPNLCIFQEVDLGARRTHGEDVAQALAKTFGMNYAFAPEFRELSQSTPEGPAYHGQAILTRFPIRSSRILRFTHQSGFWKPRPLLISSLPVMQRRVGGRIALVNELDLNGQLLVVYNLHLESRTTEHGRLLQLDEVLADAQRYPEGTPLIVAGDLNTMQRHSPSIERMREAGYNSCFGDRRIRTHIIIGALDWVFVRGPVVCEGAEVHRDFHASDHFPISAELRF
ncbi:MAG TPA: endonuclease/exonuclease/phosphatase family protein [Bryobacteraceae bacterium]|jgi:endonuclease/exonuclease/phosphatase family metal-dependent hydrolase|nr:endonuclease/exonuclease/phosphatase family protein [Bryobacteraceae bacterium]